MILKKIISPFLFAGFVVIFCICQIQVSGQSTSDSLNIKENKVNNIDPAFQGFWKMDIEKSDFGAEQKPKMGLVNWTEHGWVFAIVTPDNNLYADGIVIDEGCKLIGVPKDYSAEINVLTPRHIILTLKQNSTIVRVGDIELLDDNTTKTTHHVTPEHGRPYVETTIWKENKKKFLLSMTDTSAVGSLSASYRLAFSFASVVRDIRIAAVCLLVIGMLRRATTFVIARLYSLIWVLAKLWQSFE
jgi:hypothetical protein